MPVSVRRGGALCAAAAALVAAQAWVLLAPGRAMRWGARISADHEFTGRGSRPVEMAERDPCDPRPVDVRIRDLSSAVSAIGVRAPFSATCLEQSVALVMLLSIARIPANLVVGVSRAEPIFRAHAWVECGGVVVLGGAQAQGLTPLLRTPPADAPSSAVSSCPG